MARLNNHHKELNDQGEGKCSVPMWMGGCPAGLCDEPAFGNYIKGKTFRDGWTGEVRRLDGKYSGYVPALACQMHGGPKIRAFMDGNMWCAVKPDFINLQESDSWFAATREEAIAKVGGKS